MSAGSLRGPSAAIAPEPLTQQQVYLAFSGLMLVMLLAALDSTIVSTALPTIVGELGGLERLAWVVTAYLLAQTIVTPIYGKLGDLYGRKVVLQSAVVLFLVGSALCGMSRSMEQLILFRGIQGLGGGGLMVTTQAAVGDIVSPRERGRYQGLFGAVFGLASIAGPLLGGYFTTHWTWRWIFYINLPLGLAAMFVLAATLPAHTRRVYHAIDVLGSSLLAIALSAIVVVTDVGGTAFEWDSPAVTGLVALIVIALAGFVFAEQRAAEPVLPLRLFSSRTFTVTSAIGLIVGFALFGTVTYLPLFLQVVQGASPTSSGLQMLPMMGGMLVTSIASGQIISRTGRYRWFPIAGLAVITTGLFLMSRMHADTTLAAALGIMLVLGMGLGLVMQVLVVAVQNAVDYGDLGVATSGATLFRLIGGSIGTAVLGAIFAMRLEDNLARVLPPGTVSLGGHSGIGPQMLAGLDTATRQLYVEAFATSLGGVFLIATGIAAFGFVLAWLVPETPLRQTIAAAAGDVGSEAGEAFGMPSDSDPVPALVMGMSVLAERDVQRRHIEAIVARAGLDLSPAEAWVLVRIGADAAVDLDALARVHQVPPERLVTAREQLVARGLLVPSPGRAGALTEPGIATINRMRAARRERLAELFTEWGPEKRHELAAVLQRLADDLVPPKRA